MKNQIKKSNYGALPQEVPANDENVVIVYQGIPSSRLEELFESDWDDIYWAEKTLGKHVETSKEHLSN